MDKWINFKNVRVKGKVQKCKNVKVKSPYSQRYGFSSNHVRVWELDHKEGWVPKNWCFWTMVLEKTLEGPLDSKDIKLINPKVSQPWIFIRKTDVEFEAPILWPPDVKSQLTGKDPDAGKDWRQEEKGATEDEMIEWHRWLNGHEFEQTLGDTKGLGSLGMPQSMGSQRVRHDLATEQVSFCNRVFSEFLFCFSFSLGFQNWTKLSRSEYLAF